MTKSTTAETFYIGLDVGQKSIAVCAMNEKKTKVRQHEIVRSQEALRKLLKGYGPSKIVLEAGAHSLWISEFLVRLGHTVMVCDPAAVHHATKGRLKNDRRDAHMLAELLRTNSALLNPVKLRPMEVHADLGVARGRNALVETRTALVNSVRGLLKPFDVDLPRNCTDTFSKKVRTMIPKHLMPMVEGILNSLDTIQIQIVAYDKQIDRLATKKYPVSQRLAQVAGVGNLTALTYVLTIWDIDRFRDTRSVGAFLGLCPGLYESGNASPEMRITRRGDILLRKLLVGSAHWILGPFGKPCDLREKGMALQARGGKWAKKRAVVAIARRLAILLAALWKSNAEYEPCRRSKVAA